jgi:hypothetical protein
MDGLRRLQAVIKDLSGVSRFVAEPTILAVCPVASACSASNPLGVCIADPRGLVATDVTLTCLPHFVRPGRRFDFELRLSGGPVSAWDAVATSFAELVVVDASYNAAGGWGHVDCLPYDVDVIPGARSFRVSIAVPPLLDPDSCYRQGDVGCVRVSRISIAGESLELPASRVSSSPLIRVVCRLEAPQSLGDVSKINFVSPCVLPSGSLVLPHENSLRIFGIDGSLTLHEEAVPGLSTNLRAAVFDKVHDSLLISDSDNRHSHVCAYALHPDGSGLSLKWSAGDLNACLGFAIAHGRGVIIAGSFYDDKVKVLRLADGKCVDTMTLRNPTFMAGDAWGTPGTVYIGCSPHASNLYAVRPCEYHSDKGRLEIGPPLEALPEQEGPPPLAIVPPAVGRRCAHLVVGDKFKDGLRVISLPDLRLIHTHVLTGMQIMGLAADAYASDVLIVCDSAAAEGAGRAHVLAWPLPGMPELE